MPNSATAAPRLWQQHARLMGNQFLLSAVSADGHVAEAALQKAIAEIRRIEALLTTYSEESQTANINRMAGIAPVKVDAEVFALIRRAGKISELTQGAFDLSYGSIDKRLWNFDTGMKALPGKAEARRAVRLINFRNIELDEAAGTVFLKQEGMRIGFGGIGKGYAADRAREVMVNEGIESGVVNASGDLVAWGTQPDGRPWSIGIADPARRGQPFSALPVVNGAVATSGAYEKFALIDGRRYSHTIDPKTGLPVSGIESVTILAPAAELADALATPVMVMGRKAGLHLVNQLSGIGCILVDETGQLFTSDNIKLVS